MPTAEYAIVEKAMSSRWTRPLGRLALVVVVLVALWLAFKAFVVIRTDQLWFRTVDASQVHDTMLTSQIVLFVVFGGVTALVMVAVLTAVARAKPVDVPDRETHPWRYLFAQVEPRLRRWGFLVVGVWLGIRAGSAAAGQWQTYLLWRHAQPWGQRDAQFGRDVSYFVEILPFHQMVVSAVLATLWHAMLLTVVASYVYGTVYIRRQRPWVTRPFMAQMSLLIGLWLLAQAPNYWLSRFEASLSNGGPVTGLSYTDIHARVPGFTVLMVIAVIAAAILLVNVRLARLRYAVAGLGLMLVASLLVGSAWPALVSKFREQPSAASLDLLTVERNQAATKAAFGLGDVTTTSSSDLTALSGDQLTTQAGSTTQVRLLDPNQLSPTFNVKQQIQAYYQFKSSLDIDHYPLEATSGSSTVDQDVAIAARELNLGGIPRSSWTNRHLVYTHGYGVVAAPTDKIGATTGTPDFVNGGLPPDNAIPVDQPRIYFGQHEPNYSIVGQPKGSSRNLEFDYPGTSGAGDARTTYDGSGGVPLGSRLDRLLWGYRLSDPNVFFSSDINAASQLLTYRDPRQRVAKVAPWLRLDGDVYPVLADGHVEWVVDGYTSTSNYPASQQINLRQATSSALTSSGATVSQPSTRVNYLHNSVKAVVDAYTGKVTLYSWNQADQPDPLLKAWESVYPGLVKPESDIPGDLLDHLRYPQDLFDVQRMLLAKYHVEDAGDFYNGSGFWKVPTDPTFAATSSLNAGTTTTTASPTLASTYMSMSPTGSGDSKYLLSSPLVTLNYRDLAAFLSVDATPGPDYGRFTLLDYPAGGSTEAPAQIQNDIESDNTIAKQLTLERGGNSQVLLGNLLAIPIGDKMLYVEPVYTEATGGNSFPILRHVVAVYGNGRPAFEDTLDQALTQAFANDAATS